MEKPNESVTESKYQCGMKNKTGHCNTYPNTAKPTIIAQTCPDQLAAVTTIIPIKITVVTTIELFVVPTFAINSPETIGITVLQSVREAIRRENWVFVRFKR